MLQFFIIPQYTKCEFTVVNGAKGDTDPLPFGDHDLPNVDNIVLFFSFPILSFWVFFAISKKIIYFFIYWNKIFLLHPLSTIIVSLSLALGQTCTEIIQGKWPKRFHFWYKRRNIYTRNLKRNLQNLHQTFSSIINDKGPYTVFYKNQ